MPLGKPWRTPTVLGHRKKIRSYRKGSKSKRKERRRTKKEEKETQKVGQFKVKPKKRTFSRLVQ